MQIDTGSPAPLGATWDGSGVNFAIYSEHATGVYLCLFESADSLSEKECIPLRNRTGDVWHAYISGIRPGQLYGYRMTGPFEPENGHHYNPDKLLFDPYAKSVGRDLIWHESLYGFQYPDQFTEKDSNDSAPYAPLAKVIDPAFDWSGESRPNIALKDSIIYELHVKGFTKLWEVIPENLRGTYAGLATDPVIAFLKDLGVTAIELLPVHHSVAEHILAQKGLTNYWGYNTLAYFAPCSRYRSGNDPVGEFKYMVKRLHNAGLEVILDVVYNHTVETDHTGPTLSFRGIDNKGYYRLDPDDMSRYQDFTGCGNTLNMLNPFVLRLIMDSLRYWVSEMHVDGFRFDLASALARELFEVDRLASFFDIIAQDPVLSQVKLIAEPWDLGEGGYMVGGFPTGWSEWNGQYRDTVRRFWNTGQATTAEFVTRIAGSSDLYRKEQRKPAASINYIVSHDGFTMADLISYSTKHNDANPWNNTDGANDNYSVNMGVEGHTDNEEIRKKRLKRHMNFLVTLFTSQGVPMLLAGDERGRTQNGNNNAYCQDNEINYLDWNFNHEARRLIDVTGKLIRLRRENNVLRRPDFFYGDFASGFDLKDVYWVNERGDELSIPEWSSVSGAFGMLLPAHFGQRPDLYESIGGRTLFVFFNPTDKRVTVKIPWIILAKWDLLLRTDSLLTDQILESGESIELEADSCFVLAAQAGWKKESIERRNERNAFARLIDLSGINRSYQDLTGKTTDLNGYQLFEMLEQAMPEVGQSNSFINVIDKIKREKISRMLEPMHVIHGQKRSIEFWIPARLRHEIELLIQRDERSHTVRIDDPPEITGRTNLAKEGSPPSWQHLVRWPSDGLLPMIQVRVQIPDLPMGYYSISIQKGSDKLTESRLAVCPERCYLPHGHRKFGVTVQLYSLRSQTSEGIGDFSDLAKLGSVLYRSGYRVLGISPVHATGFSNPNNRSPYYPYSRCLVDPVYISVRSFHDCKQSGANEFVDRLLQLNSAATIDYEAVYDLKKKALYKTYKYRKQNSSFDDFYTWLESNTVAKLQAIIDTAEEIYGPGQCPFKVTTTYSEKQNEFKEANSERIEFFCYTYYLAQHEFSEARKELSRIGMSLYVDLAVGTSPDGSDPARYPGMVAKDARAGAPPDQFAPNGQNWGLAVMPPESLRSLAYEPYLEMIRANMLTDGFLRIDHAMWLFRLFWITDNAGTYVTYPSEDLIALLCLESHLHRCQIIGEDLGTVPHYVREELHRRAIYSWKVLYFERQPDGDFVDPHLFQHVSITTLNTHDLPTIEGYLTAADSKARLKAGMITEEQHRNALEARQGEIHHLEKSLIRMGMDPGDLLKHSITDESNLFPDENRLNRVVLMNRLLFRSKSGLVLTSLGDLLGELDQPNLPGTVDEYPCWKMRHAVNIEELENHEIYKAVSSLLPDSSRNS